MVILKTRAMAETFVLQTAQPRIQYFEIEFLEFGTCKSTISGQSDVIKGSGKAQIMLPNGTILSIKNALYATQSIRNLLSFKDIRLNGYHLETKSVENVEYLCITSNDTQKRILEKLHGLLSGLYYTYIKTIEAYTIMNQKFIDSNLYALA